MRVWTLALIFLLSASAALSGTDNYSFSLSDPLGDDNGPGYYLYPTDPKFAPPGAFDIASFEVSESGGVMTFKTKFRNYLMAPPYLKLPSGENLKYLFETNLYLQNIEIYIDMNHSHGEGHHSAIPGRRANFASESFWEKAILISPLPARALEALRSVAPQLEGDVVMPRNYNVYGKTVICRIPTSEIGHPSSSWGYAVLVTPASYGDDDRKKFDISGLTRPVQKSVLISDVLVKPDKWHFGGGDSSGVSSNIIDIIVPEGETQADVLRRYNAITRTLVTLKAVYPFERWAVTEESNGADHFAIVATILGKEGKTVTIDKGMKDGMYVGRIGRIIDEYDDEITNVIVDEVYDTHSVCTIMKVSMLTYVVERMKVKFE